MVENGSIWLKKLEFVHFLNLRPFCGNLRAFCGKLRASCGYPFWLKPDDMHPNLKLEGPLHVDVIFGGPAHPTASSRQIIAHSVDLPGIRGMSGLQG